ncbi:ribokinase [Pseudothermotoga hypogea DSM 11164 = NBRC 106472]|uniref:Ribokinase n=1 Tax=Pseudothermotoga hypogea DSM 11164 = NBRC 106472 TaxID=1123384 RepID=A0A0X1KPJ1_9THEM|nr:MULTISPECIES: 1-phosphofructokinase family hexose kinase [Pseudothermotoga]AJC73140.1 ribokinase [Pseudothermotoga hypogea DSM 11164 = NBRC 106472]MBC7122878.1 1-phosphofructokinase family hexose kinase [Pseudothermotoga sp.]MDI6863561.1 1-phosphofructokinase family hexose kinase [Pseudothermotoga sp.]
MKVITVTLNPALDREFIIEGFAVNAYHRIKTQDHMVMNPGGKGINVSMALAKLGVSSIAIGIIGGYTGRVLLTELNKTSPLISTSFVHIEEETRENIVIVDPVNHTMTSINSPGPRVDKKAVELLLKRYEIYLSRAEAVVLSGSLPQGLTGEIYGKMAKMAREKGRMVFFDMIDEYLTEALEICVPDVVKPDVRGSYTILQQRLESLEDYVEAAANLVKRGCKLVVVSYEIKNDVVATQDGVWLISTKEKVEPENILGAGDAYVAAMVYKRLTDRNTSMLETAKFGYAAALAKTKKLTKEMPEYDEIGEALNSCKLERLR